MENASCSTLLLASKTRTRNSWLGSLKNVRWLGMREMKDRALDALGGA